MFSNNSIAQKEWPPAPMAYNPRVRITMDASVMQFSICHHFICNLLHLCQVAVPLHPVQEPLEVFLLNGYSRYAVQPLLGLSLIHISKPTRLRRISYSV